VQWDPWIKVETGMVPMRRQLPQLGEPPTLRTTVIQGQQDPGARQAVRALVVGLVAAAITGFHGYSRNNGSLTWGLIWAAGGFVCPVVAIPFAVSQGYASRKKA